MGHTNTTPNLNLPQFVDADRPTWRGDLNGAFNDLDSAHGSIIGRLNSAESGITGKVSKGEIVINADDYASLQAALDDANTRGAGSVKRVLAKGSYNIATTLLIGSNIILDGGGSGVITKNDPGAFKMILSRNAVNPVGGVVPATSGIHIRDISLIGDGNGAEWSAGIHLAKADDCSISNVIVQNVRGDGVTIGNITDGVVGETCHRITVRDCRIVGALRQGIALTNAEDCTIKDNNISGTANGTGVDLEPNKAGELMRGNRITGNRISGGLEGITGSSVANVLTTAVDNIIADNIITDVAQCGIRWSYNDATITRNRIVRSGREGIKLINGLQGQGVLVGQNTIKDASQESNAGFVGILNDGYAHSLFQGNIFIAATANKISKLWDEINLADYNSWIGNNGRQVAVPYTIKTTSDEGHNIVNAAAMVTRHRGATYSSKVNLPGSAATAGVNIAVGGDPTTKVNGDMWVTAAGLFVQVNGSTVGPLS